MQKFKSDFLKTLDERGFIHQCSDFAGLDALAAKSARHRLHRLRLHGAVAACRLADARS